MTDPPAAGFLPVDKPVGPTSHDMVAIARRALRQRRIGHTGTLDPFASGLLLLAIGTATRLAEYLAGHTKSYAAVMRLGTATDTDDRTGEVTSTSEAWRNLTPDAIRDTLLSFHGRIEQVPPMYSARKVGGRRLYSLAREGREIEREATGTTIHSIAVTDVEGPDVAFEITCSTGTYVRSIARDAGSALGVGAHLVELRRTAIGPHHVEHAIAPDSLDDAEAVSAAWISPAAALAHLPAVEIDAAQRRALAHGQSISVPDGVGPGVAAAVEGDELVAVGEVSAGALRPRKVFAG